MRNIPIDVTQSTIASTVRRVEQLALDQLRSKDSTSSSPSQMEEYMSIIQHRKLLITKRNGGYHFRGNGRGRGQRGGNNRPPTLAIHLKYRPLGTAFFPSIDVVAAAVKEQFTNAGIHWSSSSASSTGNNQQQQQGGALVSGRLDHQDVAYWRYKNPQRLKHLKAGVLTEERLRHDADRAATLATELDREMLIPKETNHLRLQNV